MCIDTTTSKFHMLCMQHNMNGKTTQQLLNNNVNLLSPLEKLKIINSRQSTISSSDLEPACTEEGDYQWWEAYTDTEFFVNALFLESPKHIVNEANVKLYPNKKDRSEVKQWLCSNLSFEHELIDIQIKAQQRFLETKICLPSDRIIKEVASSALFKIEEDFFKKVSRKIPKKIKKQIDRLIEGESELGLSDLKKDPGRIGLKSLKQESKKLSVLRELKLPTNLFTDISKQQLLKLKRRIASESMHEIKRHPKYIKYSLFAAFTYVRIQEIADDLVDLLIQIIHKIGAKAERKVIKELVRDFKKVKKKDLLFCQVAEAAVNNPIGTVKNVIFPVASEDILKDIIKELKSSGPIYRYKVQNVMRASYIHHYRRMIPIILNSLEFRSNNTSHKPVIDGINLIKKYQDSQKQQYSNDEDVPMRLS